MFKAAEASVKLFSFAEAKSEFFTQVDNLPCAGQRHHKAQNAAGRPHIQNWDIPSTQCVLHAVRVKGKMSKTKRKLVLIDGYHRLSHWFAHDMCPFNQLIIIVHEIEADTQSLLTERIDILARTLDSKKAVKTNTDRWCAAVRDAGLKVAKSKAYQVGFRANSFFKRILRSANDSMVKLTERAAKDMDVHGLMDGLFARSENEMSKAHATEFFHAGVQTAVFYALRKAPETMREDALRQFEDILQKLSKPSSSVAYRHVVLKPEAEALYAMLVHLASPEKKKELRAIGNREDYYNEVINELKPLMDAFCASLAKAAKKRIRVAV